MNEFSGKSSSQIVSELETRRHRMRREIEGLNDQFSPEQLWETAKNSLAASNGNEFVRNLGRSVRDNPLPLAVVGAGIAWMIVDRNRDHRSIERDYLTDRAPRPANVPGPDRVSSDTATRHVVHDPEVTPGVVTRSPGPVDDNDDGPSMRSRVGDAGTRLKDSVTSARNGARDRLTTAREEAVDRLSTARDGARDRIATTSDATRRRLSDAQARSQQTISEASDRIGENYRANPLVFGLGAAAAAAVLGALLPGTRREDQVLGDYADQARDLAEDARHKATDIAGKTLDTIQDESQKRGYSADTAEESVTKAVDDARDIARKSLETIEKEGKSSSDGDRPAADGTVQSGPNPGSA